MTASQRSTFAQTYNQVAELGQNTAITAGRTQHMTSPHTHAKRNPHNTSLTITNTDLFSLTDATLTFISKLQRPDQNNYSVNVTNVFDSRTFTAPDNSP